MAENSLVSKSAWQYFVECITTKYCCFKGRANRKEFWSFILFNFLFSIAFTFIIAFALQNATHIRVLNTIWGLAFLLPMWGVLVRRLHDVNLSGWVFFAPIIAIFLLAFYSAFTAIITHNSGEPSFIKSIIFILGGIFMLVSFLTVFVCTFIRGKKPENKYGTIPQETETHWVWVMLGVVVPYVLFILFVLGVGALAGYSKAMNKYKITETMDQIVRTSYNINLLFGKDGNYAGITDQALYNGFAVPEKMIKVNDDGSHSFVNPYYGEVKFAAGDKEEPNDKKAFTIKYTDVSQNGCAEILSIKWPDIAPHFIAVTAAPEENLADNLATTRINNCVFVAQPGMAVNCGSKYVPISQAEAMNICQESNTVIFKFY